jgi:hypothetical protein
MSDVGTIDVVPSLEASFLETRPAVVFCSWLLHPFRQLYRATYRKGVVSLMSEVVFFLLVAFGCPSTVVSTTCRGLQQLTLVQSPVRCGTAS